MEPVRPRRDSVERVHEIAGKFVAWIVLAGAVILIVVHSLGLSERVHLSAESLLPIGLALLSFFYLAVVYGQKRLEEQIEQLKTSSGLRDPEWSQQIKRSIPEDLREIFAPEIDRSCQILQRAATEQEFVIRNSRLTERFSSAYGRILRRFPNSVFYATAPARKQYWQVFLSNAEGAPTVVDEFRRFMEGARSGAAMKRIFFVEDPQNLSLEECEIILPQIPILTATYAASIKTVKEMDCLRYFAIEAVGGNNPRLSWVVQTDGFEVLQVVTSLDRARAQDLLADWERIFQLFPAPLTVQAVERRMAELEKKNPSAHGERRAHH